MANLSGETTFPLPLPAGPQLLGVRLVGQGFALDSLTARGFVSSNGVLAVIGR